MRRWIAGMGFAAVVLLFLAGLAQAKSQPPAVKKKSATQEESFDKSVDLKKFRKGNFDWDTQELIASGFTALHQDHEEILKELAELKTEIAKLREER